MLVQIAGPVCELCDKALRQVEQVISAHGLDLVVEHITDFDEIVALKVYAVPGIIVDGVLKSVGRVPDQDELARWLSDDHA